MKVIKFLDRRLEEVILVLLLSCIVVIMLCQIVCRYVLNDSLSWSEEFCRYCYIWFMFVAFSYSIRFNLDLRVDAVLNLLPGALKKAVEIFGCFICLVLSAFCFITLLEQSPQCCELVKPVLVYIFLCSTFTSRA